MKKTNPELLKKTRHIWSKNPENLTDKQRARPGYLEQLNLRSSRAYLLKESFREYDTKDGTRKFFMKWSSKGMNNKAKVVSHRCYGSRTATYCIIALYHCLGRLPESQRVHTFL